METEINKYNLNEASLSVKMGENKTVSEEKIGFFVTTFHRSESIANTICNERLLVKDGIIDENFIKEEPNFFTDEANVISDKNSKITIHNESLIVKDGIIDEDFIKKEPQFLTDEEKAISEEKDTNKTIPDQYLVVKDEKIFEDFVKEEPHFSADEGKRVDSNKQDLRIAVPQKVLRTIPTSSFYGGNKKRATLTETLQYVSDVDEESSDFEDENLRDKDYMPNISDLRDAHMDSESDSDKEHEESSLVLEVNASSSEATVCADNRTQNKRKRTVIWKHVSVSDEVTFPPTPFHNDTTYEVETLRLPMEYFNEFITPDLMDTIVEQSNLYSMQKNLQKPLSLNVPELEQWLGMSMYFSISKISNTQLHWKPSLSNDKVSDIMSRDRWQEIKSNFHLSDNQNIDNNDKLFKVRPLIDHLRSKFQQIPMTEYMCIDEQLIPFKGTSSLKQYIPKKHHKWGYKFFILSDSEGMVYDFMPYVGKIKPVENPDIPDLGPSSNSVLHLVQCIPPHKNHKLFFDNWFTSFPLITYLATQGIWCCGTVQPRRLPSLNFRSDKELQRQGRGSMDVWKAEYDNISVAALKWLDTRSVCLVSTFLSDKPKDSCSRYDKKSNSRIEIPCPNIVKVYNRKMGGVDLHDQMISLYRMSFESKKYYQHFIFHLLDMAVVNSWRIYRRDAENLGLPKSKQSGLGEFKLKLSFSLMQSGKDIIKKRGRPSLNSEETAYHKKKNTGNATKPIPEKDIRLDKIGHFAAVGENRLTCKLPGCKGKVFLYCMKCNVNLCCDRNRNCFFTFHNQ